MPPAASDEAILAAVQGDIPATATPFADIAAGLGVSEERTLYLLRSLKAEGAIRRFGATLRHQKTAWKANAMVAWEATPEEAEIYGPVAAAHPRVSHAYFRPSAAPDWPYTLYAMVHGRSDAECLATVDELRRSWPLARYAVLRSLREFKKTSMTYFKNPTSER